MHDGSGCGSICIRGSVERAWTLVYSLRRGCSMSTLDVENAIGQQWPGTPSVGMAIQRGEANILGICLCISNTKHQFAIGQVVVIAIFFGIVKIIHGPAVLMLDQLPQRQLSGKASSTIVQASPNAAVSLGNLA
jgi:hypothetical protein